MPRSCWCRSWCCWRSPSSSSSFFCGAASEGSPRLAADPSATVGRRTLTDFDRALSREVHVLAGRPDLLWPQLYNRLQWGEEHVRAILAPQLRRRSTVGAASWLRLRAPYRESGALLRTLEGHTGQVAACA